MTPVVVIVNVVEVLPAGTVTEVGTVADELLLDSVVTTPLAPAGPFSVTVPVDGVPPVTVLGLTLSDEITAALMVNVAVWVKPDSVAVIVATV